MGRGIRWQLGIPPEVITEYAGTRLGDFYRDPEVMLQSQLIANEKFERLYGIRRRVSVSMTSYLTASTLGMRVEFPEDDEAQYSGERVLKSIEDVDRLRIPDDPTNCGLVPRYLKMREYIERNIGDGYLRSGEGYGVGFQGPITTAVLLRGEELFADLYLDPRRVHRFLEMVTENSLRLAERLKERVGEAQTRVASISVTDDYSGLISPEQYEEFEFPYLKRLFGAYDAPKRHLHAETLRPGHLKFLSELGVTEYDPGMNQYLSIGEIKRATGVFFYWNLFTVRDMLQGTPESIRELYERSINEGAPGMMTEICRGTPRENVKAFVDAARQYE